MAIAQLKSQIPVNLLMIMKVIFLFRKCNLPDFSQWGYCSSMQSQPNKTFMSDSECGSSRRSKCCATSRRGCCSLMCVTPRVLDKYSREGKHLNPNPIPKPFRIFFWNCRGLSITFTSKSRQTAKANLYYVTKFPLYLSVTVLSWCHHWFPREKVSEKRAQKFHSDDSSLPRAPGTWLTYPSPSPQTLLTLLCDPY